MYPPIIASVYLDMDLTLVDLEAGILKLHNRMDLYGKISMYQLEPVLNMSHRDCWMLVVAAGPAFWANLPPLPWAHELVQFAKDILGGESPVILSKPLHISGLHTGADAGRCVEGKIAWLWKHFPALATDSVFTCRKIALAGPNTLLIDDDETHEAGFELRGGKFICVPQMHNRFRDMCDNRMAAIKAQFALLMGTDDGITTNCNLRTRTIRQGHSVEMAATAHDTAIQRQYQ